ncbi:hypothetical protein [Flavobacterium sp.]|jgi:hypothetical protein|uniref:hypothetical protein n=1 Tax=Flavobacterium sp. TaxID=239 RepID=UPI0037BEBC5C
MKKEDFFKNFRYSYLILYLLWIGEWSYENSKIVTTIKNIGIVPISIFLFVLALIIDYFLNKDVSFIKTKLNAFNILVFLFILLIYFIIRFRLF